MSDAYCTICAGQHVPRSGHVPTRGIPAAEAAPGLDDFVIGTYPDGTPLRVSAATRRIWLAQGRPPNYRHDG